MGITPDGDLTLALLENTIVYSLDKDAHTSKSFANCKILISHNTSLIH